MEDDTSEDLFLWLQVWLWVPIISWTSVELNTLNLAEQSLTSLRFKVHQYKVDFVHLYFSLKVNPLWWIKVLPSLVFFTLIPFSSMTVSWSLTNIMESISMILGQTSFSSFKIKFEIWCWSILKTLQKKCDLNTTIPK